MDRLHVNQPDGDVLRFVVRVEPEGGTETEHTVTASKPTLAHLGRGFPTPVAFIEACFRFLLEREPNTSIVRSFDVDEISRYFPEFPNEIAGSG